MPTSSVSTPLEAGVRVGDFEIIHRLGAGGMGIVYKARQVSLDRVVALKVLGPALTRPADLERFQREAKAAARLKHPGINAIHFIGQDAQVCYHVMEFINGIPLQRIVDTLGRSKEAVANPDKVVTAHLSTHQSAPVVRFDGPTTVDASHDGSEEAADDGTVNYVPRGKDRGRAVGASSISAGGKQTRRTAEYIRRCCEIVRDVARALAYAHAEGVIHRDIKPENLMLDESGQVRVIDFGLARYFDDESITHTGQLLGTPLYMSPEQVTGRFKVDHRTDIYSLGLVLYELLALRRPFEATNRENLLRNIVTKPLPPLGGRNPAVTIGLEAVVHKATAKDPEERYQSAAELADDLERYLAGKSVSAPPYRFRLDLQEVIARRPGGVVIAAFIALMFACGIAMLLTCMAVMMMFITVGQAETAPTAIAMVGVQLFIALVILAVGIGVTTGLLRGWNWMRWVALVGFVLLSLASLVGVLMLLLNGLAAMNAPRDVGESGVAMQPFLMGMMAMYAIPLMMAFACCLTSVIALLRRRVGDWFQVAGRTRQEHRDMLRSLSE